MALVLQHTSEINQFGAYLDGIQWSEAGMDPLMSLRDYSRGLYDRLEMKYSKFHKMDDFCRVGFLAAERLFKEVKHTCSEEKLGLFLINKFSSIQTDELFRASYNVDNQGIPSPSLFVYTLPNILIGEISIRHKITGEHSFFVQQDFAAEFIYLYVQTLFETGAIDAAVIGSCEVTPETFGSRMGFISQATASNEVSPKFDMTNFNEWITKMPEGKI